jgi:hypothetical protein
MQLDGVRDRFLGMKRQHWCGSQSIYGLGAAPVLEFYFFTMEK